MNKYLKFLAEVLIVCVFTVVPVFAENTESDSTNSQQVEINLSNKTYNMLKNDFGELKTLTDDEIVMNASVNLLMTNTESENNKWIRNIVITIPESVDYIDNSLELTNTEGEVIDKKYYSIEEYDDADIYINDRNQSLLFSNNRTNFYDFRGNVLSEKNLSDAIYNYNNIYGSYLREDGMTIHKGVHIFKIQLKDEYEFSKVNIKCNTKKNILGNRSGRSDYSIEYMYSKEADKKQPLNVVKNTAGICYDGIVFSSCEGNGIGDISDWNYMLKNSNKIPDTTIDIYKYDVSISSDDEEGIRQIINNYGDTKYYMVSADMEKVFYRYVGNVTTDENGEAVLGGITIDDYLINEPVPPQDYSCFSSFQLVGKEKWNNISEDSSNIIEIVIVNYKGVMLPGSGLGYSHEWKYWILGGILLIGVIAVRICFAYKKYKRTQNSHNYKI